MKRVLLIVLSIFLVGLLASSASAWQVELSDAYDASGYWAYDITFSGAETDNLNDINISLGYDPEDVSLVLNGVIPYNYDDGAVPFAATTWEGGDLPYTDDPGLKMVYNIMGAEPLGEFGVFFPVAADNTKLFTIYFEEVDGGLFDDTSVYFTYGSDLTNDAVEAVTVNGIINNNHDLLITANTMSAVPVPAAVWLLGSGLLGLVGLRRRNR